MTYPSNTVCPCDPMRRYADCCARPHAGHPAEDAEALMRSRYSAFVFENAEYLLASWHPSTRPAMLDFNQDDPSRMRTVWLGLAVKSHRLTAEDRAEVEFVARCRIGGGRAERLHERSRFVREDGRWYYLDGVIDPPA